MAVDAAEAMAAERVKSILEATVPLVTEATEMKAIPAVTEATEMTAISAVTEATEITACRSRLPTLTRLCRAKYLKK